MSTKSNDSTMDVSELENKAPPDPNIQFEQLDELVSSAKQLFEEGHSLQSLELYSKALELFPRDPKILEGRVEVCIKLKLFRRCLKDIDTLTVIKPDDPKVHCSSGFIFEQVGEYEKSLSAYLKVYLLDDKCRFETANKIKNLCCLTVEGSLEDHDNTKGECIEALEQFVLFSKKLIEKEKYQGCLDILKTALMVHCMDEPTSNTFKEHLRYCSTKYNAEAEALLEAADFVESSECLRRESRSIKFLENVDSETIHYALSRASECCYRLGKLHTSIWFAEQCLENALVSENFLNELTAYSKLAFLHSESGQRDLGISHHFQVLAKCRSWLASVSDTDHLPTQPLQFWVSSLEKETLLRLCTLFEGLGLYEDAQKLAQEYFSKADIVDHGNLVKAYGMLGELERLQGYYDDSAKSHQTELALCLTFNDRGALASAYGNLGKVHLASGRFALARECHELHLKIATALQDPHSEAIACGNLGEVVVAQNKPEQALAFFEKQLRLATDNNNNNNKREARCHALMSLGMSYQVLKLFQHAESFLRRALVEAQELKMNEEHDIKKSLVEVLLSLRKSKEALALLFEVLEFLEFKFNTIRGYKILTHHPILDELNRCVDDTLELLVKVGRYDDALELAERNCGILFHQMIEYKAFVEGLEFDRHQVSLSLVQLQKLARDQKKMVLFYRVVNNGYMVWLLQPTHEGVAQFHWHRAPPESSFQETIEGHINGLLKSRNPVATYSCDHRKLHRPSHQVTSVEINEPEVSSSDPTDVLKKLSKMFLFPIEDGLSTGSDSLEIVVVKNAFLNLIPFAHLHTSSGSSLQDLAVSVQVLPCIAVLGILNSSDVNPCRQIRVLGNPEMQGISESSFAKPSNVQLDLLEEELSDVSILLGVNADVGRSATKEHFFRTFSSTSLLHLSTFGSHDDGVIAFAPVPNMNPSAVSDDSWAVTLEEIVALNEGPDVVVLNSCYGCHNRFRDIQTFTLTLPLAFMIAGVKAVVMPTWSIPRDALLASLCEFYKNLSNGSSVCKSLLKTKSFLQDCENFQEPFSWTSFNLYGCDTSIPVEKIRRRCAGSSFREAQKAVSERFPCDSPSEGSSSPLISECLVETVIQLLHRHHLYPTLLPILLDVVKEAAEILQGTTNNSYLLPYREITPPWLAQILTAKKFLTSIGFLVKSTCSQKTILIYPHWNENGCLEKVISVLQSVLHILSHSSILADALRVFVSQERKTMFVKFQDVLKQTLTNPEMILEISSQPLVRMFWVKPTSRRMMLALGFLRMGPVLDFRNEKEDSLNALESCLKIFTALTEFEDASDFKPHPMLAKANLDTSWMSQRASDEENKAKLVIAQRLDSIHSKNKQAMKDVRVWHHGILATQAKLAEGKPANKLTSNPEQLQGNIPLQKQKQKQTTPAEAVSILPRTKTSKKENLDLTTFGGRLTRIKVESGSSPSCIRVPVVKEKKIPLIDCVMKRHECHQALYQCLKHMKAKKREEIKKLVTL